MKRYIWILWLFISSAVASGQSLECDTVRCGNVDVVLYLPAKAIERAYTDNYEEGFFRCYPIGKAAHIIVHYGAMVSEPTVAGGTLLYSCEMGNVAKSRAYKDDCYYHRFDKYKQSGVAVSFRFVLEDQLESASQILDNIRIIEVGKN